MKNILLAFFVSTILYAHEKPKPNQKFSYKLSLPTTNYLKKHTTKSLFLDDCDGCGCGASGGSMGFASMINSNFVGVRYFNQQYKSNDGLYSNSPWLNENFNTVQVWARVPVFKKFQVSALIPYHNHERETQSENQSISGIGDITVLALTTVFKSKTDTVSTSFKHNLQAGMGVKLPTGAYKQANSGSVNPSFQLGTGSWDVLLTSEYVIKKKKFGLNNMINYIIKNENGKYYRFGNQFNYASTIFYLFENKKFAFAPQIGLAGELYESNYQYNQKVKNTSGDVLFSKFGFELGYKKWSFGSNLQLPINQNLVGGLVEATSRWSVNVNFKL